MDNSSDMIKARVPNRYSLVVLAAKRAKQIKEGAPLLIDTDSTNALTIALEEIAEGKISYTEAPEIVDDEAHGTADTVAPALPPAPPAEPTAMQMLTQSLEEAERAANAAEEPSHDAGEALADEDGRAPHAEAVADAMETTDDADSSTLVREEH